MAFSMFTTQASPIAIDFGQSSLKVLQMSGGVVPSLIAAAELPIPDDVRADTEKRFAFLNDALPALLKRGRFKGRKAVCSIPSAQTFIQHMPLMPGNDREEQIKLHLQLQMGWMPSNIVVRSVEVCEVNRGEGARTETICFAVPRDIVMRQVDLLKKCKLEVAGIHTEQHAMVWAFDHLHRRDEDMQLTELYVDIGWGSSKVAISHGRDLVFAKIIQAAGRHLDQHLSQALTCDTAKARSRRVARSALEVEALAAARTAAGVVTPATAGGGGTAVAEGPGAVESAAIAGINRANEVMPENEAWLDDFVGTITDDLQMCRRYHRALYPERPVSRVIFIGGEARQVGLCRRIAHALDLPARLGDPLVRLSRDESAGFDGVSFQQPQPGWAVAYGLCNAST